MPELAVRAVYPYLLLLLLAWPWAACAQDRTPQNPQVTLTGRGRVMLDGDLSGYWSSDAAGTPWRSHPDWLVSLTPGATYFVVDHVGLGASFTGAVSHTTAEDRKAREAGLLFIETRRRYALAALHVVLDIPCGKRVSILGRVTAGWGRIWSRLDLEGPAPQPQDGSGASLGELPTVRASVNYDAHLIRGALSLPVVLHIRDAIGLGLGPEITVDHISTDEPVDDGTVTPSATSSGLRTRVGLSTWVGGSF